MALRWCPHRPYDAADSLRLTVGLFNASSRSLFQFGSTPAELALTSVLLWNYSLMYCQYVAFTTSEYLTLRFQTRQTLETIASPGTESGPVDIYDFSRLWSRDRARLHLEIYSGTRSGTKLPKRHHHAVGRSIKSPKILIVPCHGPLKCCRPSASSMRSTSTTAFTWPRTLSNHPRSAKYPTLPDPALLSSSDLPD